MINPLKQINLKAKTILMRVDYNVPIKNGKVLDSFRIKSSIPTIKYCMNQGASLVLCSHLGRPNGNYDEKYSLMPIGETLADLMENQIKFSKDCISEDAHDVTLGLKPGEIHLLENLRFYKGETENDPEFSSLLGKHGEVFINDAFGTAHRKHASNIGVLNFFNQKGMGFLLEKELRYLKQVIQDPVKPFVVLLGGAKIKGKLDLIYQIIPKADSVLIGGGMAFTFLKAKGKEVGNSLVDKSMISEAKKILSQARNHSVKLVLPSDVIISEKLESPKEKLNVSVSEIPEGMGGFDIGIETIKEFGEILSKAGTVLWNGPMGVFEQEDFEGGTKGIAEICAKGREMDQTVIVGGGDTASAVNQYGLASEMSHVSTGGGASLELLSGKQLPAILALEKP